MRKIQIVVLLAVMAGAAWLTTWVDGGLGSGWTHDVVRNWHQFGFSQLHGKMVINPGGFQAETNPDIYAGHRPASLFLPFLCYQWLGATDLGFLVYYALVSGMVLLSIWWLLGRTDPAFWLAAIVVLTPGFVRWQTTLDPNLAAVLFGFPFCAGMIHLLRRPALNWIHWLILVALIFVYSSINWTTLFVHGILFVTLLVLPRVPWRHLFGYAGVTAAVGGMVLLASLASKMKSPDGSSHGLTSMFSSYGWGNEGYGLGLSTVTACVRLLTVNLLGLLPALLFLAWCWWRGRRSVKNHWFSLLPLLAAGAEVMGLRNYFGHHPWMSIHFILLGIILAATVWKEQSDPAVTPSETPSALPLRLAGLAAAFAYSVIVLAAAQMHNERELGLISLIKQHTSRDTTIVISRETDPSLAALELRLPEIFDRRLIVVADTTDTSLSNVPTPRVMLTAVTPVAGKTLAQSGSLDTGNGIMKKMLAWYSQHIAHRRAGDKLELEADYFLYQPPG